MATGGFIVPNNFTGPRVSLGTAADMQAAQLAAQAQAAQVAQLQSLGRARIGSLPMANPGVIPSTPYNADLMAQLNPTAPRAIGMGAPLESQRLIAGPPTPSVPMTQAGAVNASRAAQSSGSFAGYGSPAMRDTLVNDVSALRGVAGQAPTAVAESGVARYLPTVAGALESDAGMLGKVKGLATGKAGKLGAAIALPIAGQLAGQGVEMAGGPQELSGALKGAGTGAGIGMIAGAPGAVIGGLVGGSIGALAGPAQDLGWAEHYDDEATRTGTYANTLTKKGADDLRHKFGSVTMAIHHGNSEKASQLLGVPVDVSTMQGKALALQQTNALMKQAAMHPNHYRDNLNGTTSGGSTKNNKKKQTAVQIQMGEAMAKLASNSTARGVAEQQMYANLANDPNMAAIAPVLQMAGQQRADFGQQTADAYTGAAYMTIPQQQLDAKLAEMRQLQQQIQAAKNSSSGGSSSLSDLAAQVK